MMAVGVVLAVACAIQGTWSPCGLSMLSAITPLGERSRHHRYAWSVTWYVVGAAIGGACLGACMLAAAVAFDALPAATGTGLLLLGLGTCVCLAADARIGGFRLLEVPRQLNERWIDRMRPWAYASGFGWQVGTGVTTYVMTCGIYALILLGALTLPPLDAFFIGLTFGACRGAVLVIGATARSPEQLRSLHCRLDRLAPWSLLLPVTAEIAVLVDVVVRSGSSVALAGGVFAAGIFGAAVLRRVGKHPAMALARS